jgi:DNA-binding NtrC family response regulator
MVREEKDEYLLQTDTRVESLTGTGTVDFRVPGLTILWHPDPERVGELAPLPGLTGGQEAELSRREPSFSMPQISTLRPLADPYLSRRPIRIVPLREGRIRLVVSGTVTRLTVDGEPVVTERELSADEVDRGVVLLLSNRVALFLHYMQPFLSHKVPYYGMVGDSAAIVRVRRDIEHVCDLLVPVLISGDTGTGKEVVAEAIHKAGSRRNGPFIAINMGAIPPTLAAAELFGATKGAFTGADQKRAGYFRKAQGGTLFLDEVGETPPEMQVMLLRALETRTIQPVGSTDSEKVDVRLMAATDADLGEAVKERRFRAPLLHRLAGYEIRLPPIWRRRDDLGRLFLYFLRKELERLGEEQLLRPAAGDDRPWVPASLVARLAGYEWPGNVRQLGNIVRQMVIASRGASTLRPGPQVRQILREVPFNRTSGGFEDVDPADPSTHDSTAEDIPIEPPAEDSGPEARSGRRPVYRSPAGISELELHGALKANRWHLQATAAQLRVSRTSLYDLIDRNPRIRKASDLTREEIEEARRRLEGDLDDMVEALEVSERGLLRRMTELGMR